MWSLSKGCLCLFLWTCHYIYYREKPMAKSLRVTPGIQFLGPQHVWITTIS
jgi:hypothetical protein